jgi:GGDEF domain-containing protein
MRFDDATNAVLDHLDDLLPMGCWAVTRQDGQRQLFLQVRGHAYGMAAGDSLPWKDTCCVQMVSGLAPRIAPDAATVPGFRTAAAAQHIEIGSYIGIPMYRADGRLFGTLCAFDPSPLPAAVTDHAALFVLLAGLLAAILESDLVITEHLRESERAQRAAEIDPLTGLLNQRGWDHYIAQEEERHRRFGESSAVIVVDLDRLADINQHNGKDAGDRYLIDAGNAIRNTVRGADVVARLRGDEFGVIVDSISPNECELLVDRILDAFRGAGVVGSIGWAPYTVVSGFPGAVAAAGSALVEDKRQRRSRTGRLVLVR